jgi:16S rRNA processing protein RimM
MRKRLQRLLPDSKRQMARLPDMASGLTTLGRIGAAVGIKGWVRLISFTDPADNILKFRHFYLVPHKTPGGKVSADMPEQVELEESRIRGKDFIARIKGCEDREQARQYTGCELQVETSALPDLDENDYYWFQLAGLQVLNLQDENLGAVHHLMETGANDVLVVQATADSLDDRERLIPWIRDQVVIEVNLEKKLIRVDWEKDF